MLIVEDGTGLFNADAFVGQDYVDTYAADRELTDWLNGAGDPEATIRRATDFMSNSFLWKGSKLRGRLQSLAWPRTEVEDEDGLEVPSNEVPVEVMQATAILSVYEMAFPGGLSPAVILANSVKSERIGPIAVEYVVGSIQADAFRPVLLSVEDMLSGLLAVGGSDNGLSGLVGRA